MFELKHYLSFFLIIITSLNTVFGQQDTYASNKVSLELLDVMGLKTSARSTAMINFEFDDVSDYAKGVSMLFRDHLVVTSNREFDLLVRASSKNFTAGGYDFIPVHILRIDVENTEISGEYVKQSVEHLSTADKPLLMQMSPLIDKFFNIRYTIPSLAAYKYVFGKRPGLYTNAVIYTLTIQ